MTSPNVCRTSTEVPAIRQSITPAPTEPIPLGDFELTEPLGRGGMGEVWRARHRRADIFVGVKFLSIDSLDDLRRRRRFRKEVRSVSRLRHPNIVDIYDYGEVPSQTARASSGRFQEDQPYLVMEYGAGGTLADLDEPLAWPTLREMLLTLLEALARAHAHQIVHRDIKPSNVLLASDAAQPRLILSDFGLAYTGTDSLSGPHTESHTRGTPAYMSPEQFREQVHAYGPATDLYGLGCMAWELLSGSPPFRGDSVMAVARQHLHDAPPPLEPRGSVPEGLDSWLQRLLAKSPNDRFQSAADAACALLAFGGDADRTDPDFGRPGLFDRLDPETSTENTGPSGAYTSVPIEGWDSVDDDGVDPALHGTSLDLLADRRPRLVDRTRECARLWSLLRRVDRRSAPALVLLRGPAGAGKSRLAQWLIERAREFGCATGLRTRHSSAGDQREELTPMIAAHLSLDELPPERQSNAVESWFRQHGVQNSHASNIVDSMIAHAPEPRTGEPPKAEGLGTLDRLFAATTQFLNAASNRGPVVIHLDDLRTNEISTRFVRQAFELLDDSPLLFVGTTTENLGAESPENGPITELLDRPESTVLPVEPLDDDDRRQLTDNLLRLEPDLREHLLEQTGGNPGLVVESVRECVERECFVEDDTVFRLAEGARLPDCSDLHALFAERLETVVAAHGPDAGRALEIAAVLGRVVDWAEWRRALEAIDREPPVELLETLFRKRFARDFGASWAFSHPTLREVLVRQARRNNRWERLNAICAESLQQTGGYDPIAAYRYAYHATEAEQWDRAADRLLTALDRTRRLGAAETHGFLLERFDAVVEQLEMAPDDRRRAAHLNHRGRHLLGRHQPPSRAQSCFERALELAERHDWPAIAAEASEGLARSMHFQNEFERADRLLREAIDDYVTRINPALASRLHRARLNTLLQLGEPAAGSAAIDRALARAPDGSVSRAKALHCKGELLMHAGDLEEAKAVLEEGLELFERRGLLYGVGQVVNTLGDVVRRAGALDRAADFYERAVQIAKSTHIADLGHVFLSRVQIELERERFERADRHLERARQSAKVRNTLLFSQIQLLFEAWTAAGEREWDEFRRAWQQYAETPPDEAPHDPDLNEALRNLRDVLREHGRHDDADRVEERIGAMIRNDAAE